MAKFYELFLNFMFLGLIVFSLLAFAVSLQEDVNLDDKITDNTLLNNTYSSLRTDLEGLRGTSQEQKTLFDTFIFSF